MYLNEEIQAKWKPLLDHPDLPKIGDSHKRSVIAQVLENTESAMAQEAALQEQAHLHSWRFFRS